LELLTLLGTITFIRNFELMRLGFFIIILIFLTQSCKNQNNESLNRTLRELSNDPEINTGNLNYSFELPPDWSRHDTVIQRINVTFLLLKDTDNFKPIINVTNEHMNKGHQEYVNGTKKYLSNSMDVELLDEGEITVLGIKGLWYSYIRTFNGIKREMVYYSIPINGTSYNISAGISPGGMQKYRQSFDQIVRSFKIGKKSFTKTDSNFVQWLDSSK
jgi:hypothetical protein